MFTSATEDIKGMTESNTSLYEKSLNPQVKKLEFAQQNEENKILRVNLDSIIDPFSRCQ